MIKHLTLILAAVATLTTAVSLSASEPVASPNYELAERFSPNKMRRVVPQTSIRPSWYENSNKFWYSWQSVDDIHYYVVDPASGKKSEMWAMSDLAEKVTLATGYPFDAQPGRSCFLHRKG